MNRTKSPLLTNGWAGVGIYVYGTHNRKSFQLAPTIAREFQLK